MTSEQMTVLAVLGATVGLFLWGRFRYDVVALGALVSCVLAGLRFRRCGVFRGLAIRR